MAPAAPAAPLAARRRNRRGEGDRLREEIITAASQMIGETGDDSTLTLRGVARRVGIAAPSIYRHFTDADQLKMAVVQRSFAEFASARDAATGDGTTRPGHQWAFRFSRRWPARSAAASRQAWPAPATTRACWPPRSGPRCTAWCCCDSTPPASPGPARSSRWQTRPSPASLISKPRRTGIPPDRPPKGELPCIPSSCLVTARAPRRSQG